MTRRIDVDASPGKETAMKHHSCTSIVGAFLMAGSLGAMAASAEGMRVGNGAGTPIDRGNAARIPAREILL